MLQFNFRNDNNVFFAFKVTRIQVKMLENEKKLKKLNLERAELEGKIATPPPMEIGTLSNF